MNLTEFIKSKNERFTLLYALYLILYFILVLGIDVDFILYYIITGLIATILTFLTIIFRLEVIIDNTFFKFRKEVDMNIYKILESIWKKKVINTDCRENCKYLKETKCEYNFDINDTKIQLICMHRCFYPIINSETELSSSKSFIYQGFLNYYICIIILLISTISPFFINLTLFFNINQGLMSSDIEQLVIINIIIQLICVILLFVFQIIGNFTEQKIHKLILIFKFLALLFFLIYYIVSIFFIVLILKISTVINHNSIIIYLVIITFSLIFSLIGRNSKRIKDYILLNQELQLDEIIDLEINNGLVSKKLKKAICEDAKRKEFRDSK